MSARCVREIDETPRSGFMKLKYFIAENGEFLS